MSPTDSTRPMTRFETNALWDLIDQAPEPDVVKFQPPIEAPPVIEKGVSHDNPLSQ